ncbi:MAG: cupredoxin domain-containing protein [Alphaproteobacteria bacterium]|nr:cupredoxin domain-containing protein [Alphaproteobacteria bacterium]MBV9061314.1 cupredoxin domain-containing protein [Alphaproteobacteria bacterium]
MKFLFLILTVPLVVLSACGNESPGIPVSLKDHRFSPAEIHVRADRSALITLTNQDDSAEEFDSVSLKVEKVVPGHETGNVRIRPLAPGRYPFIGEYHADTARGVVVAE